MIAGTVPFVITHAIFAIGVLWLFPLCTCQGDEEAVTYKPIHKIETKVIVEGHSQIQCEGWLYCTPSDDALIVFIKMAGNSGSVCFNGVAIRLSKFPGSTDTTLNFKQIRGYSGYNIDSTCIALKMTSKSPLKVLIPYAESGKSYNPFKSEEDQDVEPETDHEGTDHNVPTGGRIRYLDPTQTTHPIWPIVTITLKSVIVK